MSYDLRLSGPDVEAFREVAARDPYVRADGEDEWVYQNEDTGVYFAMGIYEVVDDEEASETGYPQGPYVECAVNYLRPSFFVDEFLGAVIGYAKELGWTITDGQRSGVPQPADEVDVAAVREAWLRVTRATLGNDERPRMQADASVAMRRYNYSRGKLQLTEPLFVPTIFVARRMVEPDSALRMVVWDETTGVVFPPADVVAVMSVRRLGPFVIGKPRTRIVNFARFIAAIEPYVERRGDLIALPIERSRQAAIAARAVPGVDMEEMQMLPYDGFLDVHS